MHIFRALTSAHYHKKRMRNISLSKPEFWKLLRLRESTEKRIIFDNFNWGRTSGGSFITIDQFTINPFKSGWRKATIPRMLKIFESQNLKLSFRRSEILVAPALGFQIPNLHPEKWQNNYSGLEHEEKSKVCWFSRQKLSLISLTSKLETFSYKCFYFRANLGISREHPSLSCNRKYKRIKMHQMSSRKKRNQP